MFHKEQFSVSTNYYSILSNQFTFQLIEALFIWMPSQNISGNHPSTKQLRLKD